MKNIERIYRYRFPDKDRRAKERIWKVLCQDYFQKYVKDTDTVLDLACGFGEFIRFIKARRKIAVDINPDVESCLPPDIEFHLQQATNMSFIPSESIDVCFVSNFFEHLPSKDVMDSVLNEILRVLRKGAILVALQPNIKYSLGDYWDYYDHYIPLTHLSCAEAFIKNGFIVIEQVSRFLPFTTTSYIPKHPLLVAIYLKVRPAWRLLGRQFLIVGRKP